MNLNIFKKTIDFFFAHLLILAGLIFYDILLFINTNSEQSKDVYYFNEISFVIIVIGIIAYFILLYDDYKLNLARGKALKSFRSRQVTMMVLYIAILRGSFELINLVMTDLGKRYIDELSFSLIDKTLSESLLNESVYHFFHVMQNSIIESFVSSLIVAGIGLFIFIVYSSIHYIIKN